MSPNHNPDPCIAREVKVRVLCYLVFALMFSGVFISVAYSTITRQLSENTAPYIDRVITTAILTTEPEVVKDFPCMVCAYCEHKGNKMKVCIAASEGAHKGDNVDVKMLTIPTGGERPQLKFSYELKIATKVTPEKNP